MHKERQDVPGPVIRNEVLRIQEPRHEVIEVATGNVWQAFEPTPADWLEGVELEPGFVSVGHGAGIMDRSWFRRSPGAEADGPAEERDIAGRRFFLCARAPASFDPGPPRFGSIDKYHSVLFEAGRSVDVLNSPEGRLYVQIVGGPDSPAPTLPDGWVCETVGLDVDWIVDLPNPCETFWFRGLVSFQGPVELLKASL